MKKKYKILENINFPSDIKKLSQLDLKILAKELREELIDVVSETGGHLGAGLGVVELTVALHYVFNTPYDKLIWDVGHQSYPHKILTGRKNKINTLRQKNGLYGFVRRSESEYDPFGTAHSSTSISAGLGIKIAKEIAESIILVSKKLGLKTSALITDMNQPLGFTIGNSVEVKEAIDFLIGRERNIRLGKLILELAGEMLFNSGISDSIDSGKTLAQKKLSEGYSAECFNKMVSELGGPNNFIKTYSNDLSLAGFKKDIKADKAGYIYGEATGRGWLTLKEELIPHKHFKDGQWNHYRVVANGSRIQTWINGQQIADLTDEPAFESHPVGFIGLQVHGIKKGTGPYTVAWRKIRIREIK